MEKTEFESLMNMAEAMKITDPEHADYYAGYMRGLRRTYYGNNFGTTEQHDLWFNIPKDDPDINRRMRGCGYRTGYTQQKPDSTYSTYGPMCPDYKPQRNKRNININWIQNHKN